MAQYRTLAVLSSRGPQSLARWAELVGVTPATATRMCDRLVRRSLIGRREHDVDRRQV
ncbi:MAG: MarR family transcriptional regulator [Acidimicrobiaceae bacterium]|nr:MarR family transcriptional regulator [Acidimicrobiaceae bacterium]